jgi:uncharacterized peroxidase-related enzyme
MAFISYADSDPVEAKLAAVYDQIRAAGGGVAPNILRVSSHQPAALAAHLNLYKTLMYGQSELSRAQREMIAVVVSQINGCHY